MSRPEPCKMERTVPVTTLRSDGKCLYPCDRCDELACDLASVDGDLLCVSCLRKKLTREGRQMHPYDKVEKLLEKVRDETKKHCCLVTNVYDHRPDIIFQLYLEDGWMNNAYSHKEVSTLDEAVEFLEDFLRERASRGVLFKRFVK